MMGDAWVHPDLRRVAWMLPKAPINPHTMKVVRAGTAVLTRRDDPTSSSPRRGVFPCACTVDRPPASRGPGFCGCTEVGT